MQGQEKKLVKPFKKETAPTTGAAYISAINGLIELKFTMSHVHEVKDYYKAKSYSSIEENVK